MTIEIDDAKLLELATEAARKMAEDAIKGLFSSYQPTTQQTAIRNAVRQAFDRIAIDVLATEAVNAAMPEAIRLAAAEQALKAARAASRGAIAKMNGNTQETSHE